MLILELPQLACRPRSEPNTSISSGRATRDGQTIHDGTLLHIDVSISPSKLYTCRRSHQNTRQKTMIRCQLLQHFRSAEDSHRCTTAHRYASSDTIGRRVPCLGILRLLPRGWTKPSRATHSTIVRGCLIAYDVGS